VERRVNGLAYAALVQTPAPQKKKRNGIREMKEDSGELKA